MWLNEKDRKYLNDIYARAYKKYFAWTAPVSFGRDIPMTYNEAFDAASNQLEEYNTTRRTEITAKSDAKIAQIIKDYNARVTAINTEAGKRGLIGSTIVLYQLEQANAERQTKVERAEYDRDMSLAKYEITSNDKIRTAARKILNENMAAIKIAVQADKSSLDLIYKKTQAGGVNAIDCLKSLDEEVYAEYLHFLLTQSVEVALSYITDDPLFYFNLSAAYFEKLKAEIEKRG